MGSNGAHSRIYRDQAPEKQSTQMYMVAYDSNTIQEKTESDYYITCSREVTNNVG